MRTALLGSLPQRLLRPSGPPFALAQARLHWVRGELPDAAEGYRLAAQRDPEHADGFLAEHAVRLSVKGDLHGAIGSLAGSDLAKVPDEALEIYAKAMYDGGELEEAQRVVDGLGDRADFPLWALTIATRTSQSMPMIQSRQRRDCVSSSSGAGSRLRLDY